LEAGLGGAIPKGPSGGQTKSGASRSGSLWGEGLLGGEHVPDRFGQPAGDVDLGDLRAVAFAPLNAGWLRVTGTRARRPYNGDPPESEFS